MFDIICIGSATIDIFIDTKKSLFKKRIPFGSKILINQLKTYPGGGAINTSIGFARLGLKSACLSKIGQNSDIILKTLKKEKVNTKFLIKDKQLTTDQSIILDATGKDRTILVYKNASKQLTLDNINLKKLKTNWAYISSTIGQSLQTIKKIAHHLNKNNVKIVLNTSSYLAKQKPIKLLHCADVLIVNAKEAELLIDEKFTGQKEQFEKLTQLGPQTIVVTNGNKKVYAQHNNKKYAIMPHQDIHIKETTGAGDAFAVGFLYGLIKTNKIKLALKLGRANAESVISHYGAQNNLLTKQKAKNILN